MTSHLKVPKNWLKDELLLIPQVFLPNTRQTKKDSLIKRGQLRRKKALILTRSFG